MFARRIAVVGTGYVGLTTGACLASLGHRVVCADVDEKKIERLVSGEISIREDGLAELVSEGIAAGRLSFVVGAAAALDELEREGAPVEVMFLCVPTPMGVSGIADLVAGGAVIEEVRDALPARAVVVNKSTVPVGTAVRAAELLHRRYVAVVNNPKFLRKGSGVQDFLNPDRIVVCSSSQAAAERVAALYAGLDGLLCRFCGCLRRCCAACRAVEAPRSRVPSASLRDGARATLDLRASTAPPGSVAGRQGSALHNARHHRRPPLTVRRQIVLDTRNPWAQPVVVRRAEFDWIGVGRTLRGAVRSSVGLDEEGMDNRRDWSRWLVPGRASAGEGPRGARPHPLGLDRQYGTDGAPLHRPACRGHQVFPALWRPHRWVAAGDLAGQDQAQRGLPSGCPVTRARDLRRTRVHRRHHGHRHHRDPRGHPHDRPRMSLLPGIQFGDVRRDPTTTERAHPVLTSQPYGAAKIYGYWMARNYREVYGMFAVNGILFNHESPQRSGTFVTRKITRAVGRIKAGLDEDLHLGNLDAVRDWGYAKEYVEVMWLMLQAEEPTDYVVATGTAYTVRDFVQIAFDHTCLDWEKYVKFDERYLRPSEVNALIGDASKAAAKLDWKPRTLTPALARLIVDADYEIALAEVRSRMDRGPLT